MDHTPHRDPGTLRDLACELGRTYYATRLRRKALIAGSVRSADEPRPPRDSTRWTAYEDRRVLSERVTLDLARQLGRTLKACVVRRQRLLWQPWPR